MFAGSVRLALMPFPALDTLTFQPHGPTLVRNGMLEEFLKQASRMYGLCMDSAQTYYEAVR